jgi:mono/diheme cytochrome c family protein
LALGKEVFEKKAGGIGCQACHGMDAKGNIGPNIRGATAVQIREALATVDLMKETVKNLNAEDIEAVAAYLAYLATQP